MATKAKYTRVRAEEKKEDKPQNKARTVRDLIKEMQL